jgi:hypothetical protein
MAPHTLPGRAGFERSRQGPKRMISIRAERPVCGACPPGRGVPPREIEENPFSLGSSNFVGTRGMEVATAARPGGTPRGRDRLRPVDRSGYCTRSREEVFRRAATSVRIKILIASVERACSRSMAKPLMLSAVTRRLRTGTPVDYTFGLSLGSGLTVA